MPDFSKMTLQQLIRPEGYGCECCKRHVCAMDFLEIGQGVIQKAPDMVKAMGCVKPFVICDANTYEAAGKQAGYFKPPGNG